LKQDVEILRKINKILLKYAHAADVTPAQDVLRNRDVTSH